MDLCELRNIIERLGSVSTTQIEREALVMAALLILDAKATPPDDVPEPPAVFDPAGSEPDDEPVPDRPAPWSDVLMAFLKEEPEQEAAPVPESEHVPRKRRSKK